MEAGLGVHSLLFHRAGTECPGEMARFLPCGHLECGAQREAAAEPRTSRVSRLCGAAGPSTRSPCWPSLLLELSRGPEGESIKSPLPRGGAPAVAFPSGSPKGKLRASRK